MPRLPPRDARHDRHCPNGGQPEERCPLARAPERCRQGALGAQCAHPRPAQPPDARRSGATTGSPLEPATLDDEDATEFRAFASALQAELAPEGRLQADLASRIVMAAWRARRAARRSAPTSVVRCWEPGAARGGPARNLCRRRFRRLRPTRHVRHRPDPRQLWPARVRHSGPLPAARCWPSSHRSAPTSVVGARSQVRARSRRSSCCRRRHGRPPRPAAQFLHHVQGHDPADCPSP